MATARETMFEEIAAMAESPIGDDAVDQVNKMMARYRVQTKPGTDVGEGLTARDALGIELIDLWRAGGDAMHEKMQETIGRYRMQSKGSGKPDGKAKSKKAAKPALRKQAVAPTTPATPLPAAAARPSPAPRPRTPRIEPVAGGPRKRGKTRSECPKCHSMGVVLARSYAGDEYFSCIYCGWQAYKPADENDPAASLAVRLLGQTGSK